MLTWARRLRRKGRHCRPSLFARIRQTRTDLIWHTATKSAGRSQLAARQPDPGWATGWVTSLDGTWLPRSIPPPIHVRQPWQPRVAAPVASCWLPYTPPEPDQLDLLLASFSPPIELEAAL